MNCLTCKRFGQFCQKCIEHPRTVTFKKKIAAPRVPKDDGGRSGS